MLFTAEKFDLLKKKTKTSPYSKECNLVNTMQGEIVGGKELMSAAFDICLKQDE